MRSKATMSQLLYLRKLYEKGIGYCAANWYVHKLKDEGLTMDEASKEIGRLRNISSTHGATAMQPVNWLKIKPDDATIDKFMAEFASRVKVVRHDGK